MDEKKLLKTEKRSGRLNRNIFNTKSQITKEGEHLRLLFRYHLLQ